MKCRLGSGFCVGDKLVDVVCETVWKQRKLALSDDIEAAALT